VLEFKLAQRSFYNEYQVIFNSKNFFYKDQVNAEFRAKIQKTEFSAERITYVTQQNILVCHSEATQTTVNLLGLLLLDGIIFIHPSFDQLNI
jgi:hypothetical protein